MNFFIHILCIIPFYIIALPYAQSILSDATSSKNVNFIAYMMQYITGLSIIIVCWTFFVNALNSLYWYGQIFTLSFYANACISIAVIVFYLFMKYRRSKSLPDYY
ncbi:MAG: hypothetical protein M1114_05585 [Candidatus Dependentiae bacterium]|nr:hypothetical protein [Candidatus Dependentiae bacterium]